MREIVLDTETTGLDPKRGDRIIEIGCVELMNHIPTGNEYHVYVNPEKEISQQAFSVHGLSLNFLEKFSKFPKSVGKLLNFLKNSKLVIHNAEFDLGFLNAEFARCKISPIPRDRTIDTLRLAKEKFPGSLVNLDSLCKRFSISLDSREKHGAIVDSRLLAGVYLELLGGKQPGLSFEGKTKKFLTMVKEKAEKIGEENKRDARKIFLPTEEELQNHKKMLKSIRKSLWLS